MPSNEISLMPDGALLHYSATVKVTDMKALRAHAQRRYRALYGKKAPKLTLDQALLLALDLVPWQEPQSTMPLFAVGVEIDAEECAVF